MFYPQLNNPGYVDPVAAFSEAFNDFVETWRNQPRVDWVIMSGNLETEALELRRIGRLTAEPPRVNPAAAVRELQNPDSWDFHAALLRFFSDWLTRGIAPVTVAAMAEGQAARLG